MNGGDLARLMLKVEKTDSCWVWVGAVGKWGYGNFRLGNKTLKPHRILKALSENINPMTLNRRILACHTCDNRKCVNPTHIFWGSHSENMYDAGRKKRLYYQKVGGAVAGEKNPRAKLNENQVLDILRKLKNGLSGKKIGNLYGVSDTVIYNIKTGKLWNTAKIKSFRHAIFGVKSMT